MTLDRDPPTALQPYSALVLGATGNVGRQIVKLLVASPATQQVLVLNRRHSAELSDTPKVRQIVVSDMNTLADAAEQAARQASATLGFCAIGIGKGSRKMPAAQVRRVEVEYPESFARGCRAGGILSFGLMTAAGADARSAFSFVRIIGEKEAAVIKAGIPRLGIYKPSVIYGNSNTPGYIERLFPPLEALLPARFHGIHTNDLARAMFEGTQQALIELQQKRSGAGHLLEPEVRRYEYNDMKPFFSVATG